MNDHAPLDTATARPIFDQAFDGIAVFTYSPWQLHFANRTLAGWLRMPADELTGLPLESVFGAAWQTGGLEALLSRARLDPTLEFEATIAIEFVALGSNGASKVLVKAFHVRACNPPLVGLVLRPLANSATGLSLDAARIDPLTALPDRAFLMSRLTTLLEGERVADREFAVLFIDLDNFKQINDRHGHLIGDRVLREVAARLKRCIRDGDHIARYGGDEFVVLLERVSAMAEIEPVLSRIRAALCTPLVDFEEQLTLSLSIGVAKSAPHLRSAEDVLREADREMYATKRLASAAASGTST